ncbi:hypothetical protein ACGGZK_10105 [Agromyces sp. MMS24-K17]|uniref:DUF7882 family protein n=1 Tax=Agromyces sp. MMS24-K17 TaxID=3372850 RepID=UPI0037541ABC
MGALHLEGVGAVSVEDELLDHVFTVMIAKLRRHEPVVLTWSDEYGQEQRVFVTPVTFVRAEFDTGARIARDKVWLDRLMMAANSQGGLSLTSAVLDRAGTRIPTAHLPVASRPPAA